MSEGTAAGAMVGRWVKQRLPKFRTFSSLRHRDYLYLWTGNLFNNGATWLQQLTVGWLVWDLSKSPFLVGTVGGLSRMTCEPNVGKSLGDGGSN
jgi:hypothetical protein